MLDELKPSSAAGPKANLELRRSSTAEPCSTLPIPILSEVGPGSAQHQIGQRDHGRRSADQDQGVVGSEVVLHVEEPLDFLGHEQRLGQGEQALCELPHIRRVFFPAVTAGTGCVGNRCERRQAGRDNGPTASIMAIWEAAAAVAGLPDRHHGAGLPAGDSKAPMRPAGVGGVPDTAGPTGLWPSGRNLALQPAQLIDGTTGRQSHELPQ